MSAPAKNSGQPYGFVLVLRGIAQAAITLQRHPAALRVLCCCADFMNAEGECRISQGTIAARLGLTRQAVNKQMAVLAGYGVLEFNNDVHGPKGKTKLYQLNLDGLEEERAGQDDIEAYRERRRIERRQERGQTEPPPMGAKPRLVVHDADETEDEQTKRIAMRRAEMEEERRAEGVCLTADRLGFPAFRAALGGDITRSVSPAERAVAERAMIEAEAAQGVRYEHVRTDPCHVKIWRQVQLQTLQGVQPNSVARGAA